MRYIFMLLAMLPFLIISGQTPQSFTHYVQQNVAGHGSVVIVQDESITKLVDNMPEPPAATATPQEPQKAKKQPVADTSATAKTIVAETTKPAHSTKYEGSRVRHKVRGYRIQVYSGAGNSTAKREAKSIEAKVRKTFPELSVYCHFKSPRWVCRVGDFATRDEAQRYLSKIKSQRISAEATIVSDEVLVAQ